MRTSILGASIIAALALLPAVPAPPVFVALGASAATATTLTSAVTSGVVSSSITASVSTGVYCGTRGCHHRRKAAIMHAEKIIRDIVSQLDIRDNKKPPGPPPAPKGIPKYNWDNCYNDALKSKVHIQGPVKDNHIRVEGLPPTCMVLSTVLDGKVDGGARPTPCGSACIEYSGMTNDEYENIRQTITAKIPKGGK